jgi:hypothetical protein
VPAIRKGPQLITKVISATPAAGAVASIFLSGIGPHG